MTTEQLAIVVPAVTVVLISAINARLQARVNSQTLESQRSLAVQDRIATTYEDMLDLVGWNMEVVDVTKPILSNGGPSEPPAEQDKERIRKVQARIGVHGSPKVKEILERWAKKRSMFFVNASTLDRMQNDPWPEDEKAVYGQSVAEKWKKLEDIRKELHVIVRELEDAVSAELRA